MLSSSNYTLLSFTLFFSTILFSITLLSRTAFCDTVLLYYTTPLLAPTCSLSYPILSYPTLPYPTPHYIMLDYVMIYYAIIFHPIPHSHLLSILCPLSMNPVYRNTRSGSAVLSIRNSQVSK